MRCSADARDECTLLRGMWFGAFVAARASNSVGEAFLLESLVWEMLRV